MPRIRLIDKIPAEERQQLQQYLHRLKRRDRRIVEMVWGLKKRNPEGLTLKEIGWRVVLSRERVRQIFRESVEKMRAWAKEQEAFENRG